MDISKMKLSIAMVTYHSDAELLCRALDSVAQAVSAARVRWPSLATQFYLIDNDTARSGSQALAGMLTTLEHSGILQVQVLPMPSNVGYGAGHNACLPQLDSDYHLVLNPDVILAEDFFLQGLSYLQQESDVVMVAPLVRHEDGSPAHLCKRYPTVADLWLRGFMPRWVQHRFEERLARYRMQDLYDEGRARKDIPILSGCCMLLRTAVFRQLQGFDEHFFLYFEDFDLSIRAARHGRLAYNPAMQIVHGGGFSSRKGLWHIRQFTWSGRKFFKKHGWKWH